MRGADTAAGVAVEIFVEQHVILEMRIGRDLVGVVEDGPLAVRASEEDNFERRRESSAATSLIVMNFSRAGGAFDFEIVAVIMVELRRVSTIR